MVQVGRGRRSKGCASCRKRQIKCDGARPRCLRCKKDGYTCGGYDSSNWIVYESEDLQSKPAPKTTALQKRPSGPLSDTVRPVLGTNEYIGHLGHLLQEDSIKDKAQNSRWTGLANSARVGDLSWKCLLAFSQSFYAEANDNVAIARRGRQQYVHCLQAVGKALADRDQRTTNDTLQAVMILGAYEVLCATSDHSWLNHCQGMEALLKVKGPAGCVDKDYFELFKGCRFLILLSAHMMQTTSTLASEEWINEPWERQGVEKAAIDRLFDKMAYLIQLRYRFIRLQESRQIVSEEAIKMLGQLESWYAQWVASPDAEVTEVSTSLNEDPFPGYRTVYGFQSLYGANMYCMFQALYIVTTETILLSVDPMSLNPGDVTVMFQKSQAAALDICRSVEYHLSFSGANAMAQSIVLWPVREAWQVLGKDSSPEGQWLERRLASLMNRPTWAKVSRYILYNDWANIKYAEDPKEDRPVIEDVDD